MRFSFTEAYLAFARRCCGVWTWGGVFLDEGIGGRCDLDRGLVEGVVRIGKGHTYHFCGFGFGGWVGRYEQGLFRTEEMDAGWRGVFEEEFELDTQV